MFPVCVCMCVCDLIFSAENKSIFPSILFSFEALDVAKCVSLNSFELDSHSHSKLHFWRFFVSMKKNEKKKKFSSTHSLNEILHRLMDSFCVFSFVRASQPGNAVINHHAWEIFHIFRTFSNISHNSHPLGTREGHIRYQMITAPSVLIIITYNTSRMY